MRPESYTTIFNKTIRWRVAYPDGVYRHNSPYKWLASLKLAWNLSKGWIGVAALFIAALALWCISEGVWK